MMMKMMMIVTKRADEGYGANCNRYDNNDVGGGGTSGIGGGGSGIGGGGSGAEEDSDEEMMIKIIRSMKMCWQRRRKQK